MVRDEDGGCPRFEIEHVCPTRRVVFARRLDAIDFQLTPTTRLGGRRVVTFQIPRAIGPEGRPRLDLFAFELETEEDARALRVGEVVDLRR